MIWALLILDLEFVNASVKKLNTSECKTNPAWQTIFGEFVCGFSSGTKAEPVPNRLLTENYFTYITSGLFNHKTSERIKKHTVSVCRAPVAVPLKFLVEANLPKYRINFNKKFAPRFTRS